MTKLEMTTGKGGGMKPFDNHWLPGWKVDSIFIITRFWVMHYASYCKLWLIVLEIDQIFSILSRFRILRWAQCFGPFSICLHFVQYIWSMFCLLEFHQVWHTVECCEHRMYHLHKVKLCIGITVNFALFLCFWFWFNEIDDFQIFEVKWERVAQFESFLLWNGTTVCSLHFFVLKGWVINLCWLSCMFRIM